VTAATDPIAVVAVFRKLHAPSRLSLVVEAEAW
jgi:NhaP-type Na+/H+ or K+/H+ antiporter